VFIYCVTIYHAYDRQFLCYGKTVYVNLDGFAQTVKCCYVMLYNSRKKRYCQLSKSQWIRIKNYLFSCFFWASAKKMKLYVCQTEWISEVIKTQCLRKSTMPIRGMVKWKIKNRENFVYGLSWHEKNNDGVFFPKNENSLRYGQLKTWFLHIL
jgi:hypothetical protein